MLKNSENDQSTGHFRVFVPTTLNLKNKSHKSTNKKFWPYGIKSEQRCESQGQNTHTFSDCQNINYNIIR